MESYNNAPLGRDPQLWELAKRRASFKRHLATYLLMSVVFWVIWYLTGGPRDGNGGVPWPVWPMFGWGIGVVFHYLGAYVNHKNDGITREYEKLMAERNKP